MPGLPRPLLRQWRDEGARRKSRRRFDADALCRRGKRTAVEQLGFIRDPSRWKVACCSRRSGKTHAAAILLTDFATSRPNSLALYVTLSRLSGKRIVWRRLLELNREFELGGEANRSELTISFPNGSEIRIMGAKDEAQCDTIRGIDPAPSLVVVDEAQAFRPYVQELVEDVLEPMLIETKGSMVLIGTPGPIRSGYFYAATQHASAEMLERLNAAAPANDNSEDEGKPGRQWSVHHWTIADNPFIDDVEDELAALRRRKGWAVDHPTYQREYLGRWVTEHDALVYKYDAHRNGHQGLPDVSGPDWRCVLVVDQGYWDADAIGALWFRPGKPGVWLEELHHERKASGGDLVAMAERAWQPVKGRCMALLWDEGGGGKKVAEDARRLGLPVKPVDKGPGSKVAGIELANSALLTSCLLVPLNGQAAADAARVTWDPRARGVRLSEKYHTDMWDVVTYGLRKLVGIVPLDRAAELPTEPVADELAEAERKRRMGARAATMRQSWVDRAVGRGR